MVAWISCDHAGKTMKAGRYLVGIVLIAVSGPGRLHAAGAEPLLVAATRAGDHVAVRALLAQTREVNAAEADGTTALHWAVRAGDVELVELLLHAGANVNAANRYG